MSTVIAAVTDVFFVAKIHDAIRKAGAEMKLAVSAADTLEKARGGANLVILDLNDRAIPPIDVLTEIKADGALRNVPVVCFLSHVQADLRKKAQDAGADQVLARSVLSAKLPELLARYAG